MYFFPDELVEFAMDINTPRPVRLALLELMHNAFGLYPLPYHSVVLVVHLINSLLVLYIVGRITGNGIVGLMASCLFATFWINSEAIVCILQQDILLTTFCILCLIFFYRYISNSTRFNYLLTLLFFALALGTKETVALFLVPLLYLVSRYAVLESESASIRTNLSVAAYIPFLILSISCMYFVMTGPGPAGFVKTNFGVAKTPAHFVRSVTFCFSFPLFTEAPRFGIINLILLTPLYFLSPLEIRSRVSLLMTALVIICLPTSLLCSPSPRHLYLAAIISTTILTILFYYGTLQLSRKIRLADSLCKLIVIFYISLLVYHSYVFVNKQVKAYVNVSRILKNILETVNSSFPKGTKDVHIIFINYPASVSRSAFYSATFALWAPPHVSLRAYYSGNVGAVSEVNLPELWDDKSSFFQLSEDNTISPAEFEELTNGKGNKVYLFDPRLRSIHDVTGKDYTHLKEFFNENR